MDLSEFELIGRIAGDARLPDRFEIGIGDDAAVVRGPGRIVASVDTAVEGVHFDRSRPAGETARKAVAAAVSDLAAMGIGPGDAEILVALGAPPETSDGYLKGLADGMLSAAEEFGTDLAGGDVVAAPAIFLSVTVIAHIDDETRLVSRSGAQPGDVVALSGPVGGAAAGLALLGDLKVPDLSDLSRELLTSCQLRPQPQLAAARSLASAGATAMIDVSDGLAADLGHIARSSGVSIRVEGDDVPIMAGVAEVAVAKGTDPLAFAVSGGEDYVLALTVPEAGFPAADDAHLAATGSELLAIGAVHPQRDGEAEVRITYDGRELELGAGGHDHFRQAGDPDAAAR